MPVHEVQADIPSFELGRADATFVVKVDGAKLGELCVSQGAVVWIPVGNKVYAYKLEWARFGQVMEDQGVREEKPRTS